MERQNGEINSSNKGKIRNLSVKSDAYFFNNSHGENQIGHVFFSFLICILTVNFRELYGTPSMIKFKL